MRFVQTALILILTAGLLSADSIKDGLKKAKELENHGKYKEAVVIYKGLLKEKMDKDERFNVLLNIADIEFDKMERPDSALKYLEMAKSEFSENYRRMDEIYYRLGLVYEKLGKYKDAAEAYQTVAVRFQKSKYVDDALDGVERAFRKNFREYVAFIGDEPVTKLELDKELESVPPFYRSAYESEEGRKKLLENLINKRVLVKEAELRKLYLKSRFREELEKRRQQLLMRELYDEITSGVKVTEDEMRRFYNKNKEKYKIPARVTIRRVVVNSKAEADSIYEALKNGANLDSIIKTKSVAPDAKTGGWMRNLGKGSQPKLLVQKAFKMKLGEISKPIKIPGSNQYAIIKVIEKQEESYRPFEEVKPQIEKTLRAEKAKETWQKFTKSLWDKYKVKLIEESGEEKGTEEKKG
ncbi:MAG: peptidyl-prolyl cis-trans isomerase [Candidatus Hydrothermae bacterium]|nr:peptidyl-prolyl cis-trans isomerase [Candidatus Hydrothermae bacterium]